MSYSIDFSIATSSQIETALCKRIEGIRLSRNITQLKLAEEAGVSVRTIGRLEKGLGVSLDTFLRVLRALKIQYGLESLLPDPSVRPIERIGATSKERKRASSTSMKDKKTAWAWGDERSSIE